MSREIVQMISELHTSFLREISESEMRVYVSLIDATSAPVPLLREVCREFVYRVHLPSPAELAKALRDANASA